MRGKVNRTLKIRMIKAMIRSVVLYGSETWTADIKRLEAIETWTLRRTDKVGWTDTTQMQKYWKQLEKKIPHTHNKIQTKEVDQTHS